MQHTLKTTILLEGLEAEKQKLLESLNNKNLSLKALFAKDIKDLKPWEVTRMNGITEEIKLVVGFIKQVETVIEALDNDSQIAFNEAKNSAELWKNNYLRISTSQVELIEIMQTKFIQDNK